MSCPPKGMQVFSTAMGDVVFEGAGGSLDVQRGALRELLSGLRAPFAPSAKVGIKLHWGERGNISYLPWELAREVVDWVRGLGCEPVVFDTTVLYRGARRSSKGALEVAYEHGYSPQNLGCPVVVADGPDGRNTTELPCGIKHFEKVEAAAIIDELDGFVIFSHFKGHLAAGFGGAIKNISMGFSSRAHKQRMHADAHPELDRERCSRCGTCIEVCPTGAAQMGGDGYPRYDLSACIGCAQCIALCPQGALRVFWQTDRRIFQERLVETAAALWRRLAGRTVLVNALVKIYSDCDCLPGENKPIAEDVGFLGGYHPVELDIESIRLVGSKPFDDAHPQAPWRRQFEFAEEIGFVPKQGGSDEGG